MADRSSIGKTGKPFKMPIEWSKVREFARASGRLAKTDRLVAEIDVIDAAIAGTIGFLKQMP